LLKDNKVTLFMACERMAAKTRKQRLTWGVLLSFVTYFLSLCTLNPLVHAGTLHHTPQTKRLAAEHCSMPSAAPQTATPSSAEPERKATPLCCDLRGLHNRATADPSIQTDTAPLHVCSLRLSEIVNEKVQFVHIIQARYYSHSPPLYLFHATLLI
jgi:hypothetical protein